jgi:hypothetical protein
LTDWQVITGDGLEVMRGMPDCSIDAVVTDPPAGIAFMGKEWDRHKGGRVQWVEWMTGVMSECSRVLKPGGHALVWALPRTAHWTATAVEDAGFEIREKVYYLFGQGFPKSLDIGKAIDKAAGVEREVVGVDSTKYRRDNNGNNTYAAHVGQTGNITAPATDAARQWDGFGTALKPAVEEWILARKPIQGTVAANVIEWGVGGLNIEASRIPGDYETRERDTTGGASMFGTGKGGGEFIPATGRFPANLIHDGSPEVLAGFPSPHGAGHKLSEEESLAKWPDRSPSSSVYGNGNGLQSYGSPRFGDTGSAARFFQTCPPDEPTEARYIYAPKASKADRDEGLEGLPLRPAGCLDGNADLDNARKIGARPDLPVAPARNNHPTVKSTSLMRYLCRLITPPNGLILDPFTGSGSTGKAAMLEGFSFVGIEQDADYAAIARARIEKAAAQERQLVLDIQGVTE